MSYEAVGDHMAHRIGLRAQAMMSAVVLKPLTLLVGQLDGKQLHIRDYTPIARPINQYPDPSEIARWLH